MSIDLSTSLGDSLSINLLRAVTTARFLVTTLSHILNDADSPTMQRVLYIWHILLFRLVRIEPVFGYLIFVSPEDVKIFIFKMVVTSLGLFKDLVCF